MTTKTRGAICGRPLVLPWIGLEALLIVLLAGGCGPRVMQTRASPPESLAPVLVTPAGAVPASDVAAEAGEIRVATLRVQPRAELVAPVLQALFEAFRTRNPGGLEPWLDDNVIDLYGDGESRSKQAFLIELQARLKSTTFEQLELESVYHLREVQMASLDDLIDSHRPRPPTMTRHELSVRVPILAPRLGGEVLFGDEIRLLLRRHGDRYRIRGYGEVVPRG